MELGRPKMGMQKKVPTTNSRKRGFNGYATPGIVGSLSYFTGSTLLGIDVFVFLAFEQVWYFKCFCS